MAGILQFTTKDGGTVLVEVDEAVARAAGGQELGSGLVPKGAEPMSAKGLRDVVAKVPKTLEEAMTGLRHYAEAVQGVIGDLKVTPKEVSVQFGLKLSGGADFLIASAKGEADMRVTLKWEPASKPAAPPADKAPSAG
jgi:hypothetical protein